MPLTPAIWLCSPSDKAMSVMLMSWISAALTPSSFRRRASRPGSAALDRAVSGGIDPADVLVTIETDFELNVAQMATHPFVHAYQATHLPDEGGIDALRAMATGRPAQLDEGQLAALRGALLQGAMAHDGKDQGMVVVRDAESGALRAPTAEDYRALVPSAAAAKAKPTAKAHTTGSTDHSRKGNL